MAPTETRAQIIADYNGGMTSKEIAERYHMNPKVVYNNLSRWSKKGLVELRTSRKPEHKKETATETETAVEPDIDVARKPAEKTGNDNSDKQDRTLDRCISDVDTQMRFFEGEHTRSAASLALSYISEMWGETFDFPETQKKELLIDKISEAKTKLFDYLGDDPDECEKPDDPRIGTAVGRLEILGEFVDSLKESADVEITGKYALNDSGTSEIEVTINDVMFVVTIRRKDSAE